MSRLRAKRSAWGSYANCWKSLGAGTTPGCGVGKAPGKRPIRPCSGNWCVCTRNTLPGAGQPVHMLKPAFHCSRGRVHRLMKPPASTPSERGLQSHHQLPPPLSHRAKPAPTPVHFSRPNQAWVATSPTSHRGRLLYLAIVKDLCTRKIVGYAFSQAH